MVSAAARQQTRCAKRMSDRQTMVAPMFFRRRRHRRAAAAFTHSFCLLGVCV